MTEPQATSDETAPTFSHPVTVIQPSRGWVSIDLAELRRYRDLFFFMVWRDVKIKYKQALLGFAWAVLVPFSQMVIFSLIFGRLANLSSDGLPRPIYYYAALLPWTYFATALTMSSNSLVSGANFLTKIYFPRLIIPVSPCVAGLVDFAIAFVVLLGLMWWLGVTPAMSALLLPLLMVMAFSTALGFGLVLSALNVKYRDIRYVIPFMIQIWMYATVIVPFSSVPKDLGPTRYLYGLNPMAGVVEGFRWCLAHNRMSVEREGSLLLDESDIVAPMALADRLLGGEDVLSKYLADRVDTSDADELRKGLNAVIAGEPIHRAERFPPGIVSDRSRELLATRADSPMSVFLKRWLLTSSARETMARHADQRLNRQLLRDAYPHEIAEIGTVREKVEAPWRLLLAGFPVTALMLLFGLYYFKRTERMFADVV